jgi:asparagine synthase (glutamine-hydrolysing)
MTALAGFWSFGAADAAESCQRMLRSQAIYGPQGSAAWNGGEIAIGRALHRTLPEDAYDRAPQTGGSGLALVADVRLDNRAPLMAELGLSHSCPLPDAAILLHALERWGEDAVERLLGDFAFALWDPAKRRLTLARDFLGQRPLHYHRGRDFFAFASMAKGLHTLPDVPYAPDMTAAIEFVALLPEAGARTFFEGVSKVEAGHIVTVTADGIASRAYWRPRLDPILLKRDEEYWEAMREQMDRAVRARLRGADTRVASTLSAGLDSAVVTATAARLMNGGGKLFAFTSAPRPDYELPSVRGSIGDERALAAATAALYPNIEHVLVGAGGGNPLADLDRNFFLYERPVLNLCNQLWFSSIFEGARARNCGVLLTGMLGNLSFSYQGMDLLPRLLQRGRLLRLAREAVALRRNGTRLGTIAAQTLGPFLPVPLWKAIGRIRGSSIDIADLTAINPAMLDRIDAAQAEAGVDLSFRPSLDGQAIRLKALARVDFANYGKGILGGWGIDMRDPTADRELVEFSLRVPAEQYLAKGMRRALARRAFADRIPEAVSQETRKGYQAVDWHEGLSAAREELREELGRIAGTEEAAAALDTDKMKALVENWPDGGWHKTKIVQPYRLALLRGVSTGHFIRKASRSNN